MTLTFTLQNLLTAEKHDREPENKKADMQENKVGLTLTNVVGISGVGLKQLGRNGFDCDCGLFWGLGFVVDPGTLSIFGNPPENEYTLQKLFAMRVWWVLETLVDLTGFCREGGFTAFNPAQQKAKLLVTFFRKT